MISNKEIYPFIDNILLWYVARIEVIRAGEMPERNETFVGL